MNRQDAKATGQAQPEWFVADAQIEVMAERYNRIFAEPELPKRVERLILMNCAALRRLVAAYKTLRDERTGGQCVLRQKDTAAVYWSPGFASPRVVPGWVSAFALAAPVLAGNETPAEVARWMEVTVDEVEVAVLFEDMLFRLAHRAQHHKGRAGLWATVVDWWRERKWWA